MIIMAQFILPSDSFGQNKLFASISHLYFVLEVRVIFSMTTLINIVYLYHCMQARFDKLNILVGKCSLLEFC